MEVQWKVVADSTKRFEYRFADYVFKGYSGQDNVQVASAIEVIVKRVRERYPGVKEICLQSDNATCFASHELIPFIWHLNKESKSMDNPIISK